MSHDKHAVRFCEWRRLNCYRMEICMIEIREEQERVILFGVAATRMDGGSFGDTAEESMEASLDELEELVATAGGVTLAKVIQKLENPNPGTYLGKGKIEEIREMARELGATGVVCDDELSPVQLRNLEQALDIKVMDRTLVILDIFATRATSSEGKIQVELAQLKYRAARLVGLGNSLSRLGGGIGTRGPGESKLEMDRRGIHARIGQLKSELEQVKNHRQTNRKQRNQNHIPVLAIVGYTNAGKSTLLNTLTGAGILAEDKLFATLDPTTRIYELERGEQVLLTDTVGFINKLPHHLIEAFKSTLEEARYADMILHVVDSSNPVFSSQMHVVYETLKSLGVEDKTVITLFNKQDKREKKGFLRDFKADYTLGISAKTGDGLEDLKALLTKILREKKRYLEHTFSYGEAGKIQIIRTCGQLLEEEYREDGIFVRGYVPEEVAGRLKI